MKILRSPNLVCGVLLAYTTGMYIYFFPRNHSMSLSEKWLMVAASYIVIVVLWFLLRRRKKMRDKAEQERYGTYAQDNKPKEERGEQQKKL